MNKKSDICTCSMLMFIKMSKDRLAICCFLTKIHCVSNLYMYYLLDHIIFLKFILYIAIVKKNNNGYHVICSINLDVEVRRFFIV
jgi:hypothetical protein